MLKKTVDVKHPISRSDFDKPGINTNQGPCTRNFQTVGVELHGVDGELEEFVGRASNIFSFIAVS